MKYAALFVVVCVLPLLLASSVVNAQVTGAACATFCNTTATNDLANCIAVSTSNTQTTLCQQLALAQYASCVSQCPSSSATPSVSPMPMSSTPTPSMTLVPIGCQRNCFLTSMSIVSDCVSRAHTPLQVSNCQALFNPYVSNCLSGCISPSPSASATALQSVSLSLTATGTPIADSCVRTCVYNADQQFRTCADAGGWTPFIVSTCMSAASTAQVNCQLTTCVTPTITATKTPTQTFSAAPTPTTTTVSDPCERQCILYGANTLTVCLRTASTQSQIDSCNSHYTSVVNTCTQTCVSRTPTPSNTPARSVSHSATPTMTVVSDHCTRQCVVFADSLLRLCLNTAPGSCSTVYAGNYTYCMNQCVQPSRIVSATVTTSRTVAPVPSSQTLVNCLIDCHGSSLAVYELCLVTAANSLGRALCYSNQQHDLAACPAACAGH